MSIIDGTLRCRVECEGCDAQAIAEPEESQETSPAKPRRFRLTVEGPESSRDTEELTLSAAGLDDDASEEEIESTMDAYLDVFIGNCVTASWEEL